MERNTFVKLQMDKLLPTRRTWTSTTTHSSTLQYWRGREDGEDSERPTDTANGHGESVQEPREGRREQISERRFLSILTVFLLVFIWILLPTGLAAHHHVLLGSKYENLRTDQELGPSEQEDSASISPDSKASAAASAYDEGDSLEPSRDAQQVSEVEESDGVADNNGVAGNFLETVGLFGQEPGDGVLMTLQGIGVLLPWSRCQCMPVLPFPSVVVDDSGGKNKALKKNLTENFKSNTYRSEWARQEYIARTKDALRDSPPSGVYAVTVEANEVVAAMVFALKNATKETVEELKSINGGAVYQVLKLRDRLNEVEETLLTMQKRVYHRVDNYWAFYWAFILLVLSVAMLRSTFTYNNLKHDLMMIKRSLMDHQVVEMVVRRDDGVGGGVREPPVLTPFIPPPPQMQ